MRAFCIKLPLLTLFFLTALSCPKEIPSRPARSLPSIRSLQPASMLPARTFFPRTEITLRDTRISPVDGIVELY